MLVKSYRSVWRLMLASCVGQTKWEDRLECVLHVVLSIDKLNIRLASNPKIIGLLRRLVSAAHNQTACSQESYASWFLFDIRIINPLVFEDYPKVMKKIVRSRLPSFTEEQSQQLKGSFDFIGLNHYSSIWVKDNSNASETAPRDFNADLFAKFACESSSSFSSKAVRRSLS